MKFISTFQQKESSLTVFRFFSTFSTRSRSLIEIACSSFVYKKSKDFPISLSIFALWSVLFPSDFSGIFLLC